MPESAPSVVVVVMVVPVEVEDWDCWCWVSGLLISEYSGVGDGSATGKERLRSSEKQKVSIINSNAKMI